MELQKILVDNKKEFLLYNRKKQNFKHIKECKWSPKTQKKIERICKKYHISFEMCIAQAFQESSWNTKVIGDNGLAYGTWQIHPSTWKRELKRWGYSYNDMLNVYKQCEVYCRIMKSHFEKYEDVEIALMAWRCGGYDGYVKWKQNGADEYATSILKRSEKYERTRGY